MEVQPPPAAPQNKPLLRAAGVRKVFHMGDSAIEVLKGVDLSVRPGEFIAIEGRSGSGKSTLLHILAGLDAMDDGSVQFNGVEYASRVSRPGTSQPWLKRLSRWSIAAAIACIPLMLVSMVAAFLLITSRPPVSQQLFKAAAFFQWSAVALFLTWIALLIARAIIHHNREAPLTRLRNDEFGFVFQFYHLLPELNVLENAMLTPMIGGARHGRGRGTRREQRQRAADVLTQLGMQHRLTHRPNQLSGGERQRVAIARALMNEPKVLFADEPTGNLDVETGKQIMGVLEKLHQERGQTIVMVTHDRQIAGQADRVLVLKDGKLAAPAPDA